jgi:AraC-like DNA-binding protein
MRLYSNFSNRLDTLPSFLYPVNVYRRSVMEPAEYNSPLCILYVQKGKIEKRVNNRRLQLSSGDLVMISPNSRVMISSSGEFSGVSAFFPNISLLLPDNYSGSNNAAEISKMFSNYILQKPTHEKLKNHFDHLIRETVSDETPDPFLRISEMLKNDISYYIDRLPLVNRKKITTKLDILQRVESIRLNIEENCVQKFDLDTIAKISLMSKFALIRNFKEVFKTTPHQYYVLNKVTLAKKFLIDGMSVKETAMRCGYPDIFSFSKQFKMIQGNSPRKFQLELKEEFDLRHS